jgi:peptide subunit release factor 1 (eRF1)
MPLYVKIDFRGDNSRLAAWHSREATAGWGELQSSISETRLRDVFIALADEIDPIKRDEPILGPKMTREARAIEAVAKSIADYCKSPEDALALVRGTAQGKIPYLKIEY